MNERICACCKVKFLTLTNQSQCLCCKIKFFLGKKKSDYPKEEFQKFTLYFKYEKK